MSTKALGSALALVALLGATCRADAQTDEPRVTVLLENLDGKAQFSVDGYAPHLPDGTMLHISLQVRDHHPVIEAGLFRVVVKGGKYAGTQEWPKKTFAPLAYRTVVDLHMEMQSPANKRFLSKELGYTSEQVETISATDTLVGTDEERAAFQVQTLRTLSDYVERVGALHGQLAGMVQKAADDPAWAGFETPFVAELKRSLEELKTLQDTRVVWYDGGMFASLNQAIRQVSRALRKHKQNDSMVQAELNNTANDLRVMRDEIASRLPSDPETPAAGGNQDGSPRIPAPSPPGGQ